MAGRGHNVPWGKESKITRMPGVVPDPHTLFSQWMIRKNFSDRGLAASIGCHFTTIQRIREGKRPSNMVRRVLLALWPDCPLPKDGKQTYYENSLPSPDPIGPPIVDRVALRTRKAAYYAGVARRAKARAEWARKHPNPAPPA